MDDLALAPSLPVPPSPSLEDEDDASDGSHLRGLFWGYNKLMWTRCQKGT